MLEFTILSVHRIISGMQNGRGYARDNKGLLITTGLLILMVILTPLLIHINFVTGFLLFTSLMGTIGVENSFLRHIKWIPKDIHFWENLLVNDFWLVWVLSGYNIPMIIASVYPALIVHKGLINLGSGLPFFDNRTDDKTGKTYHIPLLGIRVPRSGTIYRLVMAGISVGFVVVNYFWLGWVLRFEDFF